MYEEKEDQQPQPDMGNSRFMSPMGLYGSAIITLTNPENELYKMELSFRSMIMDKEGNPKQVGQPLMNDKGISSVLGQVQSLVNQVTVMSNLKMAQIESLGQMFGDSLASDLMMNRINYDIKSNSRTIIFSIALSTAYITMMRAFEEGDKRFWKGSVQEIRSSVEGQRKGGGFLEKLNPFK